MILNGVIVVILCRSYCPTLFDVLYVVGLLVQYSHISNVFCVNNLYSFFAALFLATKVVVMRIMW